MTVPLTRRRRSGLLPLAIGATVVALLIGMRVADLVPAAGPVGLGDPALALAPAAEDDAPAGAAVPASSPGAFSPDASSPASSSASASTGGFGRAAAPAPGLVVALADIRSDVDFWAARLEAHPADIVAAVKLAEARVAEARATGDVSSYLRAEQAADAALAAQPAYVPAMAAKASILVALHRFADAKVLALRVLDRSPGDPTAVGVLGDASLELGDLATAREAYDALTAGDDGSAARVRDGRLAFVTGDPAAAVASDRAAVAAADDEGLDGSALSFQDVTLGEMLRATGDPAGAREAYAAALEARPGDPAALVGLARLDAFGGELDRAIDELDAAIAVIPSPDWLALRSDLLERRAGTGDARAAAADRATVEAIASLAGDAAGVYDRNLSLYLSDHRLDPDRAVRLAGDELAARPDVYGYDALAWALLNAGRASGARAPMASALGEGTRDARLWYHAGLVAAANGDAEAARRYLRDALALGPALDPAARDRAAEALGALGTRP